MQTEGLIAAAFGAFHKDGSLNLDLIRVVVEKLIADGASGIFVCGTNGEGPNMTVEERMAVAEAYVQASEKRLRIMVHVGHSSIADARRLAVHAAHIGADAISAVAAFYFKPGSVRNLVKSMAQIASAAPALPFYYYHIPTLTGVGMDMLEFLQLGEEAIPNLAGIKYTAHTLFEYQSCVSYKNGKYDVLYGFDEMLLPALAVGAKAAVGSTYTFAAPVYLKVVRAFNEGRLDEARELQGKMVEMIRRMVKYPPIPAQKAIMKMLGIDFGPCRLPLEALTSTDYETLKASLEEIGFFDLLNDAGAKRGEKDPAALSV